MMPSDLEYATRHRTEVGCGHPIRSDAERHVLDAIKAAREGMSWAAIGLFVGTSGEVARQRYGNRVA